MYQDVSNLEQILGPQAVVTDSDQLQAMNTDWTERWQGKGQLALFPRTSEEISAALRYCNEQKLAVVPQAGRTSLIGGSIPIFDEVIISVAKMNNLQKFDDFNGVLSAEAGCIAEDISSHVQEFGYELPYNLGSRASCQLGGNIATNVGGSKFVKHGSLRYNVLGLEVVLADGTILDDMSTIRKDNAGYDLKQLFIGSEGTLGIVTKAALKCPTTDPTK